MSSEDPKYIKPTGNISAGWSQPTPDLYDETDSDNVCFLCGDPQYELSVEVTRFGFPFVFKKCQCGLEKQTPMPNEAFFEWFFNSDLFISSKKSDAEEIWGFYDYFKDEPCRMATSRRRYRVLKPFLEAAGKSSIMKIGPSTGTMLHVCQERGHDVLGCDVSEQFVDYARKAYGVQIDNGRFEHMNYADESFDAILLFNVLENVPNQDEFLSAIYRALKPGGYLILNYVEMHRNILASVQGEKYFLYRPPICYSYTGTVLDAILDKFGFDVVQRRLDIRYLHLEKIFTLLRWRWAYRIARALRLNRLKFPLWAYPSRIVVAQKR